MFAEIHEDIFWLRDIFGSAFGGLFGHFESFTGGEMTNYMYESCPCISFISSSVIVFTSLSSIFFK